jgi:hypothetical protein
VLDLPTEREWTSQGLHYSAKGLLNRPIRVGERGTQVAVMR